MSSADLEPLRIAARLPRLLIASVPTYVEVRVHRLLADALGEVTLELHSASIPTGVAQRSFIFGAQEFVRDVKVEFEPVKPGHYPLSVRVSTHSARGVLRAEGAWVHDLDVIREPKSVETFNITVKEHSYFAPLADGAMNFSPDDDLNKLIRHRFEDAPWEEVALVWHSRLVRTGLAAGLELFEKRYRLIRPLGQGGMGVVWLALDQQLQSEVALKFLPETTALDEAALDDLKRQTATSVKLTHENIVRVFDFKQGDGTAAVCMEYVPGVNLTQHRLAQPQRVLSPQDILRWLPDVCAALDYAHRQGMAHGDVKPLNFILTPEGRIKLCDLGVAGRLAESATGRSGGAMGSYGTREYQSPQAALLGSRLASDDIYSLAATLYELLTGKPVFFTGSLEHQIEKVEPPSIAGRRRSLNLSASLPPVPEHWERAIKAGLSKQQKDRPKTAGALLDLLRKGKTPVITQAKPTLRWLPWAAGFVSVGALALWIKAPPVNDTALTRERETAAQAARDLAEQNKVLQQQLEKARNTPPKEVVRVEKVTVVDPAMQKERDEAMRQAKDLQQKLDDARKKAEAVKQPSLIERLTTTGNSLKMKFVYFADLASAKVLGCIHETRSKDFAAFIADKNRGYEMTGSDADDWRKYEFKPAGKSVGIPVGRGKGERAEDSDHPVCNVSYEDAQAFCQWLTAKERREGLIGPKDEYRLPSDAEWSLMVGLSKESGSTPAEKSTNGKSSGVYPWGSWPDTKNPPTGKVGNYADETAKAAAATFGDYYIKGYTDGFATTAPVMSFDHNSKGFYDLGGNVWEWCGDWYDGERGDKKNRVLRGASWILSDESYLLSSLRINLVPGYRYIYIGFRCVLVVGSGG